MAQAKSAAVAKQAKPTEPEQPAAQLALAAESSDPAVHSLLANRQAALAGGDEAAAVAVTARLAELGYQ